MRSSRHTEGGQTLAELMITMVVLGTFFAGIFELSALCLRYISATKENIAAVECVQDRLEQLRAAEFSSLIDPAFVATTPAVPAASPAPSPPQRRNLTTPSNASELARNATEIVTISAFSGAGATTPTVTYTRSPGAKINNGVAFNDVNILPSVSWSGGSSLASAKAVQVDVTYRWTGRAGRQREVTGSTIIAAGNKK